MPDDIRLIVGLGNPGRNYENTRHNVGFRVADGFQSLYGSGKWYNWKSGSVAQAVVKGSSLWLAKPQTYMNASGSFVREFAEYHKIPASSVLVVSDDIDLPLGRIRIRKRGSSGGQKGLESVLEALGTQEVPRLRLGVGSLPGVDATAFVLQSFLPKDRPEVEAMLERACQALQKVCHEGLDAAMNAYNAASKED